MILKPKAQKWDKQRLKYEIARRGLTIRGLSKESGFSEGSLRMAFQRPSLKVNKFIAGKLNVSLCDLWPDWFDADGDLIPARWRRKLSSARHSLASHESQVTA